MYLIYKTDNHHSFKSRDVIGVVEEEKNIIKICQLQAKKEEFVITGEQIFNLSNYKQTQGYVGDGEFVVEQVNINELL